MNIQDEKNRSGRNIVSIKIRLPTIIKLTLSPNPNYPYFQDPS